MIIYLYIILNIDVYMQLKIAQIKLLEQKVEKQNAMQK